MSWLQKRQREGEHRHESVGRGSVPVVLAVVLFNLIFWLPDSGPAQVECHSAVAIALSVAVTSIPPPVCVPKVVDHLSVQRRHPPGLTLGHGNGEFVVLTVTVWTALVHWIDRAIRVPSRRWRNCMQCHAPESGALPASHHNDGRRIIAMWWVSATGSSGARVVEGRVERSRRDPRRSI